MDGFDLTLCQERWRAGHLPDALVSGFAQKSPKREYKREAFELFSQMLDIVKMDVTRILSVRVQSEEEVREAALAIEERAEHIGKVTYTHPNDDGIFSKERGSESAAAQAAMGAVAAAMASSRAAAPGGVPKVGRNDPCPCGSRKKYKQCHRRLA